MYGITVSTYVDDSYDPYCDDFDSRWNNDVVTQLNLHWGRKAKSFTLPAIFSASKPESEYGFYFIENALAIRYGHEKVKHFTLPFTWQYHSEHIAAHGNIWVKIGEAGVPTSKYSSVDAVKYWGNITRIKWGIGQGKDEKVLNITAHTIKIIHRLRYLSWLPIEAVFYLHEFESKEPVGGDNGWIMCTRPAKITDSYDETLSKAIGSGKSLGVDYS